MVGLHSLTSIFIEAKPQPMATKKQNFHLKKFIMDFQIHSSKRKALMNPVGKQSFDDIDHWKYKIVTAVFVRKQIEGDSISLH